MKKSIFMAGLVAALATTSVVGAKDLRLGPGAPNVHPAHTPLYVNFAKYLPEETGGAVTGTIMGTEVANVPNMKASLASNIVQVGNILPLYYAADLPNTALMGELAFLGQSPHAMAAALTEYVVNCGDCKAEFKAMGNVYAGSGSSDPYILLTTKPIRSAADMKGMRLRSGGSPFARWADYTGAAGVGMPVSSTFEAISQGTIDGTMASVSDLVSYRLVDLVKYATELTLGTYHATSNFSISLDSWTEMSVEERAGVMRAANRANPTFTQNWAYERPTVSHQTGVDAGIEFITPDQDLIDLTAKFVKDDVAALGALADSQYGISDGDAKIATFVALVAKWEAIIAETGNDPVAIAEAVQKEVWDKVDYSTYGL